MRHRHVELLDTAAKRKGLTAAGKGGIARRKREFAPQKGVAVTPDALDEVAAVYREAWKRGAPVTDAVAQRFHISRSTAGKRIMMARKAGLLDGIGRGAR